MKIMHQKPWLLTFICFLVLLSHINSLAQENAVKVVKRPALTPNEQEEALNFIMKDMKEGPFSPGLENDEVLKSALRMNIKNWQVSPDDEMRKLEIKKECLYLETSIFFYDSWKKRDKKVPSSDAAIRPFIVCLEALIKDDWPELDTAVAKLFLDSFSKSREQIRENPMVPAGKKEISPNELMETRKRLGERIKAIRVESKRWGKNIVIDEKNWETEPLMIKLMNESSREWTRLTQDMDVVDINSTIIMDSMRNYDRRIRDINMEINKAIPNLDEKLKRKSLAMRNNMKIEMEVVNIKKGVEKINTSIDDIAIKRNKDVLKVETKNNDKASHELKTSKPVIKINDEENGFKYKTLACFVVIALVFTSFASISYLKKRK